MKFVIFRDQFNQNVQILTCSTSSKNNIHTPSKVLNILFGGFQEYESTLLDNEYFCIRYWSIYQFIFHNQDFVWIVTQLFFL